MTRLVTMFLSVIALVIFLGSAIHSCVLLQIENYQQQIIQQHAQQDAEHLEQQFGFHK